MSQEPAPPPRAEPTRLIERTVLSRSVLRRDRPVPTGSTAIIYLDKRGQLYRAQRPLTAGESWLATPREMYLVDTSVHPAVLEMGLPAYEEAFSFAATVRLSWKVDDPLAAVQTGLADAEKVYRPFLEERLREITRQFGVEDNAAAEREVNGRYRDQVVAIGQGLVLTQISARLDLDRGTRQHLAEQTYRTRKITNAERDEHKVKALHRITALEAEHAQRLAMLEERHRLELEKERMFFYADALRAGDLNLIALRLSSNRDDVNDVIKLVMEQRQLDYESAHGTLTALLEQKLVNRTDVTDIMARATKVVADHLSRPAFNLDGGVTAPALETGSPKPLAPAGEDEDDDGRG